MEKKTEGNAYYKWDDFNPFVYVQEYYAQIFPADRKILINIVKFYKHYQPKGKFLEIGCGPNLYPIFAMLPYADSIDIIEYSSNNIDYLKKQVVSFQDIWYQWISLLRELDPIKYNIDFQYQLRDKVKIYRDSIFNLPSDKYDSVSMHFVSESLTDDIHEFHKANSKFIGALKPNGTFVASFMENSRGSFSAGTFFPAVPITDLHIKNSLNSLVNDLHVLKIPSEPELVKIVHTGMLMATGRKK